MQAAADPCSPSLPSLSQGFRSYEAIPRQHVSLPIALLLLRISKAILPLWIHRPMPVASSPGFFTRTTSFLFQNTQSFQHSPPTETTLSPALVTLHKMIP